MSNLVLDKRMVGKPREKYWVSYIKQRIKKNKNFLGFISGPTGSGKSWSSLRIAEELDPEFNADRIVFSGIELMKLINGSDLKKGSVVVFEEAGIGMSNKNWQSTINKMLNFLIQTFRHRNFILIFNSPFMDFVDASTRKLFHAELSTITINQNKKQCRLKPRLIQYNSRQNKFYYKMLRAITPKGVLPVDVWNVDKPSEELIKAYEVRKKAFTDELNQKIQQELEDFESNSGRNIKTDLTKHQEDVLEYLKEGLDVNTIAEECMVKESAIRKTMRQIRAKGWQIQAIKDKNNLKVLHYIVKEPDNAPT